MACAAAPNASAAELLLCAAYTVPSYHYLLALLAAALTFLYNFLEFHFLHDLLGGLRGDRVGLTFHPASEIYEVVASKCRVLHQRYAPTPWLASPHFQTAFLNYFGRAPVFTYKRQLYSVRDGGIVALDWLLASDVAGHCANPLRTISKDDATPIVVVIPGLTSDSAASYIRHLAHTTAKRGWNVVVSNHRGLGGVSLTTDCFYNAGWTEDVREVLNYLHQKHPNAPLFAVGTSIGANILVKYLGEDGESTPVAGATAICSPWDLVICDRFITRKLVQRFYNRVLTNGLQGYAQLHQSILTRLANWDGITKSRSVRDFDHHATCLVGKFETVDTYYRHCTSANFVGNVSVPLLCISALDDPVCTREAIPWDECRANKNIVLATTAHGGHLAFFKGITARSLWWVGAVNEFLGVLYSSPLMHQQKSEIPRVHPSLESTIDKSPYVNIMEDGMVAPLGNDGADIGSAPDLNNDQTNHETNPEKVAMVGDQGEERAQVGVGSVHESASSSDLKAEDDHAQIICDSTTHVKRSINQLSRQSRRSMWLLAYIAIVTTWPLLGIVFKRKLRGVITAAWFRR